MIKDSVENKFEQIVLASVKACGLIAYDWDYNKKTKTLRIFIMNLKTKTALLEDCVSVDQAIDTHLVDATWLPEGFTLEVSSPGVYRNLKTIEHFKMSIGDKAELELRGEAEVLKKIGFTSQKKVKLTAVIKKVDGDSIELVSANKETLVVPFEIIYKANIVI